MWRFKEDIYEYKKTSKDYFAFYKARRKEIKKDPRKKAALINEFNLSRIENIDKHLENKEQYPEEFYEEEFRTTIMNEQSNLCGLCGKDILEESPHLHHIDYNKQNCSRDNLVFLCSKCHGKTNSNREFWQDYLPFLRS